MAKTHPAEVKKITVSDNRQVTIPKRFCQKLGIGHHVICELHEDKLILRPIPKHKDFVADGFKD